MAVSLVAATNVVQAGYSGGPMNYVGGGDSCNPCNPCAPCPSLCGTGGNWGLRADLLWWSANVDGGLPYGTVDSTVVNSTAALSTFLGDVRTLDFKWKPGFRLGLGYDLSCDCDSWDFQLLWTHIRPHANGSTDLNPSGLERFVPAWGVGFGANSFTNDFTGFTKATASWRLHFDLLDFELGRDFHVSNCLSVRPFIGVRGGWIKQNFNISIYDSTGLLREGVHLGTEFAGVGLRTGLNSEWRLGCGFSLYGNGAFSIIYGTQKNPVAVALANASTLLSPYVPTNAQHHDFDASRAILDASAGIRWTTFFCCDTISLSFAFGWDQIYLWNQSGFDNINLGLPSITNPGTVQATNPQFNVYDLSLKGITFSLALGF